MFYKLDMIFYYYLIDLLPFYAILRSIPSKIFGVIAMFGAILILLILPIVDKSSIRGIQNKPLSKVAFYLFVANFLILMQLGAKHVEEPFIMIGQICTFLYFSYFLILIPIISLYENNLIIILSSKYQPILKDNTIYYRANEYGSLYKSKRDDLKSFS